MTTITKERIELFIKNPLENGLTRGEQMELAQIALASLEAEPVAYIFKHPAGKLFWALTDESNKEQSDVIPVYADSPAPVVPDEIDVNDVPRAVTYFKTHRDCYADGWNACRAAMLQSGNFRENKNSSTNNFREIAETSTNYPVIPSEVLSAILKVAKIRADFDDFDGDRRGIGDCLDEAEQELIVTINKYASQLAAEPIATNDVREQTAIPQVPVTPDGWISCSERMPNTKTAVLVAVEFDRKGDWRMKWATYIPGHPDANDGWIIPGASWKPSHWMPLPEPPQEVNQ
ncbi:Eaa protein (plasmid) [Escherichia coli]|uniref:Eaa protein n=1 Tax=Escherichia coli TaxID=562 RepID=A0A2U2VCS4_ECOLX|nr:Eaa protein [Escherichia coli]